MVFRLASIAAAPLGASPAFDVTPVGFERLLPSSCKQSGGLCSSCSGRRMAELSAHLVDRVFPRVPTRQWVLTLPFSLRYKLAWSHELTKRVLSEFYSVIQEFYCERAEARGVTGGRSGAVTAIQRVGSAINLNVHYHSEFADGVFARGDDGALHFHPLDELTDDDVAFLVLRFTPSDTSRFTIFGIAL